MKKITIIIICVFAFLTIQAQDYLISFAGSGDTNAVSTIKVDNLTTGATVTLNGEDTLHLSTSTGISTLHSDNVKLQIYPNPMAWTAILTFDAPETGNAVICIIDVSGKTVNQISTMLSCGTYSFRISGLSQGIYFVKVTGMTYNYSTKLISQGNLQNQTRIEYVSSVPIPTGSRVKSSTSMIDMLYTEGDLLLYKGTSGQYSTIVTDVPTSNKTITFNFQLCQDADGNNYSIVKIGTQVWMAENLNVGVRIDGIHDQTNDLIIEKYCYNDSVNNCNTYGGLYQWDEMMQYVINQGVTGICPTDWQIPTGTDWIVLGAFLGGDSIAGGKMKETGYEYWTSPNTGATNETGFTALPGGLRGNAGFFERTKYAIFWSSLQADVNNAWIRDLIHDGKHIDKDYVGKAHGFSVRCVRD